MAAYHKLSDAVGSVYLFDLMVEKSDKTTVLMYVVDLPPTQRSLS